VTDSLPPLVDTLFEPAAFGRCSLTETEFRQCVTILVERLQGTWIVDAIVRHHRSLQGLNLICERAALLSSLTEVPGFTKVVRHIRNHPKPSLYEPHGAWFHLTVGLLCQKSEITLDGFEVRVPGHPPVDLSLQGGATVIECRSFSMGDKFTSRLSDWLSGTPVPEPEGPHAFTRGIRAWGPCGVSEPLRWNEFRRFCSAAIADKARQSLPGHCHILAFNTDHFGPLGAIKNAVTQMCTEDGQVPFSAFLLIERTPLTDMRLRGGAFEITLVPHPQRLTEIPTDLSRSLNGSRYVGLGALPP
jgi:hypothetical protein